MRRVVAIAYLCAAYLGLGFVGAIVVQDTAQAATSCPALPAFPDENCTGWRHTGVTLTPYSGPTTITTPGTVIDSKIVNSNLTISADNVTIKRSEINGQIFITGNSRTGVLLEDVAVDGQNANGGGAGQCIGGNASRAGGATAAGFVIRRANIKGCGQGVYGRGFTLVDSYIHDLYASGADHTEAILGHTGDIVISHNRLVAKWRDSDCTGACGMSAVIALYSHSSFWPDIDGVLVEKNWMETASPGRAGYCLYGGNSPDNTGNASNTIYRDNVFALGSGKVCGTYGPVVYLPTGGNNCWSGNSYEDGKIITASLPKCIDSDRSLPPANLSVR